MKKHFFQFAILPFLVFGNPSFAQEVSGEVGISGNSSFVPEMNAGISCNEMSTSDKLKVGFSGLTELLSKLFELLGGACISIATFWLGSLYVVAKERDGIKFIAEVLCSNPYSAGITLGTPVVSGGVGLASLGVDAGLEYLSKKVMPSEKQPEKVVAIESFETNNTKIDEHIDLNKKILNASYQNNNLEGDQT